MIQLDIIRLLQNIRVPQLIRKMCAHFVDVHKHRLGLIIEHPGNAGGHTLINLGLVQRIMISERLVIINHRNLMAGKIIVQTLAFNLAIKILGIKTRSIGILEDISIAK